MASETRGTRIVLRGDAAEHIRRGMHTLAEAVKVTLGPRGRTVVLERPAGPQIVNSGVVVARAIELPDPFENMGAQLLREVAARTSEMAGDGTTTATVLAQAMVQEGVKALAAGLNPVQLRRGMDLAIHHVLGELKAIARPCAGPKEIAHVASISANNDPLVGDLVARAMEKATRDGAVSIEDGSGMDSELEVVEGLKFDRGFLSAFFVTDAERERTVLEDPLVLVCDRRLSGLAELVPLLEAAAQAAKPLLVIAEEVEGDVLATLVVNTMRGILRCCAVKAPGFGDQRKAALEDIALVTGAQLLSSETGVALEHAGLQQLGRARRISVDRDSTTIVGGGGDPSALRDKLSMLRRERERLAPGYDRDKLEQRIARLAGGVAVIKVGAATETELKERKLRVEDALHATRAAVEEGVVPGGGIALLWAQRALRDVHGEGLEQQAGLRIVARALEEPLRQILANASLDPSPVLDRVRAGDTPAFGYDVAGERYGDLLEMGVIDPAKVTRLALQNAASIAGLVLTVDCLVAAAPAPFEP